MQIRVLGPVDVVRGDDIVTLTAPKERKLLATLSANPNRVLSADVLVDELWGDAAPRTALRTLHTYVSRLRRVVPGHIGAEPAGYVLRVELDELDASAFRAAVAAGRLAMLRSEPADAARLLGRALELWRGDAYGGVARDGSVAVDSTALDELRLSASEHWVEARLDSGDSDAVVADLEMLVAQHPLRERFWVLLMRALYRDGRQAESLRAFQRAREVLLEELGVDPGPELRAEEQAVLRQDANRNVTAPQPTCSYVANRDGLNIGYWTRGSGEHDVVFCAEVFFNLELLADMVGMWAFLAPLARTSRLIAVQRRGTGVSDRDHGTLLAPLTDCVADIDAVLDEVGSRRTALVGWGHGGQVALAYAAIRPERVSNVAVVNSYGRLSESADNPAGRPAAFLEGFYELVASVWGTHHDLFPIFDPAISTDPDVVRRMTRIERLVASPREAAELRRALDDIDVRSLLPTVQCPVLVVALTNSITGVPLATALAEDLPNAEFVELPGYFVPTDADAMVAAETVCRFLSRADQPGTRTMRPRVTGVSGPTA